MFSELNIMGSFSEEHYSLASSAATSFVGLT